ncbi:MAG: hypothetical protein SPI03_03450, partial [Campylobacter sputorum]|nr:hypothetical protein [Campylobacter sputorum]
MFRKVSNKISLIVLGLLAISFIIFSIISYNNTKESIITLAQSSKLSSSHSANAFTNEFFAEVIYGVEKLALYAKNHPNEFLSDRATFANKIADMSNLSYISRFIIGYGDNGDNYNIIVNDDKAAEVEYIPNYVQSKGWYQEAIKQGKTFFMLPYYSSSLKAMSLKIVKPVIIDGKSVAVVGADVEVDELNEAYGRMKDSPTALINIIDLDFNELVYDPDKSKMMSKSDAVKTYVKTLIDDYNTNGNKASELTTSTGDTRIASCEKYESANWLICSVNSMSDYDTMLNSTLSSQVILSIVFIVVIVSILIFTITRALKPISTIQSGLNNVFKFINHETKDANTINVKTKDEFGAMAKAINENIEKTKKNLSDEEIFIKQADTFVDSIKEGNFSKAFEATSSNPALNNLKEAFKELQITLQERIASNAHDLLDLLNSYANKDFTAKLNDNGIMSKNVNKLGIEISNMLKQNLSQAESLQQKSDLLSKAVDQITSSAKKQASSLEES